MTDKKMKITIGILCISALLCFLSSLIVPFFFFEGEKTQGLVFAFFLCAFGLFGLLLIVFTMKHGMPALKPVLSENFPLPFDSYEEFVCFLSRRLEKKKFITRDGIYDDFPILFSSRETGLFVTVKCYLIVRAQQIPENAKEIMDDILEECLNWIYKSYVPPYAETIMIFWTETETQELHELVDNNIWQKPRRRGYLPIAIASSEKKMFLAKQKDGYGLLIYKNMRKEWLRMMKEAYEEHGIDVSKMKF